MLLRVRTVMLAAALAAGLAGAVAAQQAGRKQADYYVNFENGRVMRVLNTTEQGEWTTLIIDARNHLTVPTKAIASIEKITPIEQMAAVSSINVMNEQPGGDAPLVYDSTYAGGAPPPASAPPAPRNPTADVMRDQMRQQRGTLRDRVQISDGVEATPVARPGEDKP
jgi:hypothetical protein